MPAGLGNPDTIVRIQSPGGVVPDVDSQTTKQANAFFRAQSGLAQGLNFAHKIVEIGGNYFEYVKNAGREYLTLTLAPTTGVSVQEASPVVAQQVNLTDTMLDGYVCAILQWGSSIGSGPFNFNFETFFNGVHIGTLSPVSLGQQSQMAITLTFGKEPFRSHSYVDKINPNKLLNPIIPLRKDKLLPAYSPIAMKYHKSVGPDGFWSNMIWAGGATVGDYPLFLPGSAGGGFTAQRYIQIDYPDINSSPLRLTGVNTFHAIADDFYQQANSIVVVAEFFDRKGKRQVQQSWHHPYSENQTIVVNDRPRYWGNELLFANGSICPLFDLSSDYGTDPYEFVLPKGVDPPNPKDCTA